MLNLESSMRRLRLASYRRSCAAASGTPPAMSDVITQLRGEVMTSARESRDVQWGDRLYRSLVAELAAAGCFRRTPTWNVTYGALLIGGYAAAYATLLTAPGLGVRVAAIVVLACLTVHAGFIAHEAGHGAITRKRRVAVLVAQVFDTFLAGFCASHFADIHRRHHPHCNDRERDPDIRSGAFSMYRQSAEEKVGLGRLISRHQGFLIWILICLQGVTLKLDALRFVCRNLRTTRADQVFWLAHFGLWFVLPGLVLGLPAALLNYGLMTLLGGPYVGAIFVVNHVGTRVIEPDEPISFLVQEVSTTRNLGTSALLNFVTGGLSNHIEHHLFPSMPTGRLRAARPIVREFCRRHGIVYHETSWRAAARDVTRHFTAMAAFVPGR
jgi:fatty acid desaturase